MTLLKAAEVSVLGLGRGGQIAGYRPTAAGAAQEPEGDVVDDLNLRFTTRARRLRPAADSLDRLIYDLFDVIILDNVGLGHGCNLPRLHLDHPAVQGYL